MAEENRATDPTLERPAEEHTVKSATEARQGQVVLGRWSHLIWILSIVVIAILALVFWAL